MTLALNRNNGGITSASNSNSKGDENAGPTDQTPWVAKRGRHLQLINSTVFQKEAELRSQSSPRMGEKSIGLNSPRYQDTNKIRQPSTPRTAVPSTFSGHLLEIDGLSFEVCDGGRRLVRVTGLAPAHPVHRLLTAVQDSQAESRPTPDQVVVSNVVFHRADDGNLERAGGTHTGSVLSPRLPLMDLTVVRQATPTRDRTLCKKFSNTGIVTPLSISDTPQHHMYLGFITY